MHRVGYAHALVAMALLSLGYGIRAEPTAATDEHPLVKVAMARAKVEIAMNDASVYFLDRLTGRHLQLAGWNATCAASEAAKEKIKALLNAAIDTETKKGAAKNAAFIRDCSLRVNAIDTDWKQTGIVDGTTYVDWQEAGYCWDSLVTGFNEAKGRVVDSCKDGRVDISVFTILYTAMETRVYELKAIAEQTVEAAKKQQLEWETKLSDTQSFLASHVAFN